MLARLRELFNRLGHKKTMPLTFAAALEEWEQTLRAERAAQERLEQAKFLCDGLPIDFSKIVNTAVSEEDLVRLKRLLASNSPAGGGGAARRRTLRSGGGRPRGAPPPAPTCPC